jgi:hypothetical protein
MKGGEGMDKGAFHADNAHGDLVNAMDTLGVIPRMVAGGVFEEDTTPSDIDLLESIVESGLAWVERAMRDLATGFPDAVKYEPYGFCEVKETQEKAPETPEQDTPEA